MILTSRNSHSFRRPNKSPIGRSVDSPCRQCNDASTKS